MLPQPFSVYSSDLCKLKLMELAFPFSDGRQEDAFLRCHSSPTASAGNSQKKIHQHQRTHPGSAAGLQRAKVHQRVDRCREGNIQREVLAAPEELWTDCPVSGAQDRV